MTFSPILRSDKVRADTFNQRFQQFEDRLNGFNPSQDVLVDWAVLSSPVATIDINAIPQSYGALLLLMKNKNNSSSEYGYFELNGDAAANCNSREAYDLQFTQARLDTYFRFASASPAGAYGYVRALIVNYTATIANIHVTSVRADTNYTPLRMHVNGLYKNGPITSIGIRANLDTGTSYALYGLKS